METGQERTEEATPRRIEEAIAEGNIAKSQELSSAGLMLAACLVLLLGGAQFMAGLRQVLEDSIHSLGSQPLSLGEAVRLLRGLLPATAGIVGPMVAVLMVAALAMHLMQNGGFRFSNKGLQFKVERLHPVQGLKKIFSLRGVVRTAGSVLRLLAVALVVYLALRGRIREFAEYGQLPLEEALASGAALVLWVFLVIALCLVVLGLLDYAYQRWQWRKDLRMTRQEIKDEHKRDEGDQEIKKNVRARQAQFSQESLKKSVESATVIITNPTHYAVALEYEEGEGSAPRVVAKGMDHMALEIRRLARQFAVPVFEQPPLARSLFRDVPVGQTIPESLYKAVANVLAFVYRLRRERVRR